ncbi:MAG: hypothetical protein OXR73_20670, partial [Myxococcales bacterium]|nr:hypothetical protein [Myxococcales bacterium]
MSTIRARHHRVGVRMGRSAAAPRQAKADRQRRLPGEMEAQRRPDRLARLPNVPPCRPPVLRHGPAVTEAPTGHP